jgi:sugar lactone lactonase YvrE
MRKPTLVHGLALAVFICAGPSLAADTRNTTDSDVGRSFRSLAEFSSGTFLENLVLNSRGSVIFTDYTGKRILTFDPASPSEPEVVATFDVHPAGIARFGNYFLVTAHGQSFFAGAGFMDTQMILILDEGGQEVRRIAVPQARFLNGIAVGPDGLALIADSVAGKIWQLELGSGRLSEWISHEALTADPAATVPRPGANGLKFRGDSLFVSNSSRGAIYRIELFRGARAPAAPVLFAQTGPVDDFAFDNEGAIIAATHGATLIRIASNGAVTSILPDGCGGCTAIALSGDGSHAYVLTTGGLLEGLSEPARLLSLQLN